MLCSWNVLKPFPCPIFSHLPRMRCSHLRLLGSIRCLCLPQDDSPYMLHREQAMASLCVCQLALLNWAYLSGLLSQFIRHKCTPQKCWNSVGGQKQKLDWCCTNNVYLAWVLIVVNYFVVLYFFKAVIEIKYWTLLFLLNITYSNF